MKLRERWRRGLRLTKADNLQVCNALRKARRTGAHRFARKLEAILLAGQELATQKSVAKVVGVSANCVTRWVMAFVREGVPGLRVRKPPGARRKLTPAQERRFRRMIEGGPEACGYDTGVWDAPLVRDLILKRFRVSYSVSQIRVVLHRLKLSVRRPKHPSAAADPSARRKWLRRDFPAIKKEAAQEGGVLGAEDEVGFKQSGTTHTTWGPEGEVSNVKSAPGRASCRAFGFTTLEEEPKFSFRFEPKSFTGATFKRFLEQLTTRYTSKGKKLHVILDGAPCHTGVRKWAEAHPDKIKLHFLPAYSPDLNPQEQVWRVTKKRATHDRYFPTTKALHDAVKRRFNRYQGNPTALRNVIRPFT